MATTSLKLPDDLKKRAAAAAKTRGLSPHAFMVDAIQSAATATENRARLVADALSARAAMMKSGKGYAAEEVHAYLRNRARGKTAGKPKAQPWRG